MKTKILTAAIVLGAAAIANAQSSPWILNQSSYCQPGWAWVCKDLPHEKAVFRADFENKFDSTNSYGFRAIHETNTNKGGQVGFAGQTSMDNYAGQIGRAISRSAQTHGYFAQGQIYGHTGSARPEHLQNYDQTKTSWAVGVRAGRDSTRSRLRAV